jgi:hypothetical protein
MRGDDEGGGGEDQRDRNRRIGAPGDRFSLIRLKCNFHPRISLMRHRSHRTPGMNVPPSPDFDL